MRYILVMGAGIAAAIISLQFLPAPYIWIFTSWFIAFLMLSKYTATAKIKLLFFYLSFVPLVFGIFETYLWISKKPEAWGVFQKEALIKNHEILGYAPRKNNTATHRRYYENKVIFDVLYNIDTDGLRISPPYNAYENLGSIIFFGCSFTFGMGVKDNETMPYQVGIKLHGSYRIYNFGFLGYGPHQMLSAIEHGMAERIVKNKPKYVIYQALLDHIGRAAGLAFRDATGPKYILNKDGVIVYNGHFDKRMFTILNKSLILNKILKKKFSPEHFNKKYVNLFIEIVGASRKMMETRYPGCEFHVILWNENKHQNNREVIEKLKEKGIRVHLISDIFKSINAYGRQPELKIDLHDPHPNQLAYEIIADYIVRQIIKN